MYLNAETPDSTQGFYDLLAKEYHLIFADWRYSVRWNGEILDKLIRQEIGKPAVSVLDCSCGIGTQAIGLALRGYDVTGTDLSAQAIERAKREAKWFGVSVNFTVADIRNLETEVNGSFEVVISCDNSLPHLLSNADLELAAKIIRSKLKAEGLFIASIRDYDRILLEKPKSTLPQVFSDAEGRRIVFQVWDWLDDGRRYVFHLFIMKEIHGEWKVSRYSAQYRGLYRKELTEILSATGFTGIRWLMPEESGYYQPIVIAHSRPTN
jgi:SAM-dependent methyltransferase